MLKKISAVCIGFLVFHPVIAQTDSTKKSTTTFTGSVDAYYRYNFNAPLGSTNNLTSFTNSQNSFELGMASLRVDHTMGKVAATADLGFGRRAQEFSYNDGGTSMQMIKQAYLSYAPSSTFKLTMGKWATHVGWELLDAYANRNYSMSYGFSYGPFFHTGLKADIGLGGKSALMVGVANPTDFTTTTSTVKVFIGQFSTGTANDKLKAWLNFQGATGLTHFNLVLNYIFSSQFNMVYDGNLQSTAQTTGTVTENSSWKSHALYLNYDPVSSFGLTLRGDYFDDRKVNPLISNADKIFALTLSGNAKVDNLTIIPELRLDNAKGTPFSKSDGTATKSTVSFLLAATYKF
jgi:hypothetical protein